MMGMTFRRAAFIGCFVIWGLVTGGMLLFEAWLDDLFLILIFSGVGGLLGIFWVGLIIFALIKAIGHSIQRNFRLAGRLALVPAAAVAALLIGGDLSTVLRYWVELPAMQRTIEAKRQQGGDPVFHYFMWGGFLGDSHGVAYDETDGIAVPPDQRTDGWMATRKECYRVGQSLGSHFYFVYTCN